MSPTLRYVCLIAAILLTATTAFAGPADSLLTLARISAEPSQRDAYRYQAGMLYYRSGVSDSALMVFAELRSSQNPELRIEALNAIRNVYAGQSEHPAVLADRRRTLTIYISIGVVLALGIIFSLFYRNRRVRDRLYEERHVAQAIIESEQRERIRIARDLDESIGQMLAVLRTQLSALEAEAPPTLTDSVAKATGLVDRTASEVRSISHNLIPEELNFGLVSAVKSLCEKISTAGSLQVFAEIDEPLRQKKFPIHFELSLYRIIQEVLTGMIRHSAASIIRIRLEPDRDQLRVLLQDNGRGFDTARVKDSEGLGWKNIAARVRLLQGSMDVGSEREHGNQVIIRVPLQS